MRELHSIEFQDLFISQFQHFHWITKSPLEDFNLSSPIFSNKFQLHRRDTFNDKNTISYLAIHHLLEKASGSISIATAVLQDFVFPIAQETMLWTGVNSLLFSMVAIVPVKYSRPDWHIDRSPQEKGLTNSGDEVDCSSMSNYSLVVLYPVVGEPTFFKTISAPERQCLFSEDGVMLPTYSNSDQSWNFNVSRVSDCIDNNLSLFSSDESAASLLPPSSSPAQSLHQPFLSNGRGSVHVTGREFGALHSVPASNAGDKRLLLRFEV